MYIHIAERHNKILIAELNEDYKVEFKTTKAFQPELLVEANHETEYKSLLDNKTLHKIVFDNVKDFKDYKQNHKNIGNDTLYGDIGPEYQYIRANYKNQKKFKSRFWYLDIETAIPDDGFPNPEFTPVPITLIQIAESDSNTKYILGWMKVFAEKPDVRYFYYDNEVEMLQGFIQFQHLKTPAITVAWNGDGFDFPYLVNRIEKVGLNPNNLSPFGVLEEFKSVVFGKEMKIRKPVGYVWLDYIECFKKSDPSGKESWSLEFMSKYVLGKDIGGKIDYTKEGFKNMRDFLTGKYNPDLDITGNLKEHYNKPSFEQAHYNLFVEYGIKDVEILKDMDKKTGICNMLVNYAHNMGTNIYDVFATIKPWTIYIWNSLYERKQFLPNKTPFETYHTVGGHVFAKAGLHKWVISEDYTSLYPFCMICLNLSPETYVLRDEVPNDLKKLTESFYRYAEDETKTFCEDIYIALPQVHKEAITKLLQKYNFTMAPNGSFYRKDVLGIMTELVKNIYLARKDFKNIMLKAKGEVEKAKTNNEDYTKFSDIVNVNDINQYVEKIKINAVYGAVASTTMNISNSDISNAITSYGRLNIKLTTQRIVDEINLLNPEFKTYTVQQDTDSCYLSLEGIVDYLVKQKPDATREEKVKFLENFMSKVVTPIIAKSSTEISNMFNAYEDGMKMDAEIIADVFVSTGKKRYAARIWWDEGTTLSKPKKKVVGLDIKRSDTPTDARIKLGSILDYIFEDNNKELINMIKTYEIEMKQLPIDLVAIPTGVSDITKYEGVTKSVPMHVRASLVFNKYINDNNMKQYMKINNGDKIKYIFLKKNNITPSEVIAFNDSDFIYETGLDKYIDYNRLFERTFLKPVTSLTDAIGWETKKSGTIKKLF